MTAAVVCTVVAVAASALLWRGMRGVYAAPVLQRQNYRGHTLPVGGGIVVVLTTLAVAAVARAVALHGMPTPDDARIGSSLAAAALLALGFGLLGLLDDLAGDAAGTGGRRGFRGHLGAAAHGEITTGVVKLAGGVLLGLLVAAGRGGAVDVARAALLVAASANLGNLFDRAPGRTVKVTLLGTVVVLACGVAAVDVVGVLVVVGAGAGMLVPDLRERCMLGDTGSNVLGAAVGLGLVVALGDAGQWVALAVVVALNVASDVVSFSRVIDRVAPLRWVDRLGAQSGRRSP